MIKENKKNKIITFLCACLIVCASALGLVQAVGTTLASSPTQPTITVENFTNYALYNNYDYVLQAYVGSNTTGLVIGSNVPTAFSGVATSYSAYSYSNNAVTDITSQITRFEFYKYFTSQYFKITYLNNAGATFLAQTYFIVVAEYNGVYYYCISNTMNTYRTIYNQGLADADTTSAYNNGYNTGYSEGQTAGYNSGVTQGQNNVVNNPNDYNLYTQAQYEQNYTNGYNTGVTQGQNNVINNPNAYGLYTQAQYQQNYTDGYNAGITQGQNNVINNPNDFGLNTNQQLQDSYNQGFADGEQSSDAYQNGYDTGYTNGSNEVLNNPNNYNLFTQAQYEQNYTDGYNQGVLNSQYGILSNVDIGGLVDVGGVVDGINNSDFTFNAGTITPNASLLNKLNTIFNSSTDITSYAYIDFTFNEQYVYSRDNVINFVNLTLLPNQTSYLPVTFITNSNQSVALIYSFNPIIENNVFTGFNVGIIPDSNGDNEDILIGNTIKSIVINYFQSDFDGLLITGENLVKPQALSIFATSVLFDNGYNVGYIDGTRSDVVNNAYDRGVVDGFNSGYAEGLANQDNATFASMISAVIDVPINAMRNLFNFELLGINLFGFFTALFTLLVVITIIRLILGGK